MDYEQLVSPLMEFINQGADKQLGSRKRDSDGNIQMTKWDHITGRTQEELNTAARKRLLDSDDAARYTRLTDGDIVPENMRSGDLRRDLVRLEDLKDATKIYLATANNEGKGALAGLNTDAEVYQKINELNTANDDAAALKPGGRVYMLNRDEQRYVDALNNQTAMQGFQMQQAQNQFALQQDQMRLQMRRDDMKEARSERQDRQAMIMMLMKGLSTMGASIAI